MFRHNNIISVEILSNNLYKLKLDNVFTESLLTLHHNVGTKRGLVNKSSVYLWHRHFGHISKIRIEKLVKNKSFSILILLILIFVWIVLRENKQNKQVRKEP